MYKPTHAYRPTRASAAQHRAYHGRRTLGACWVQRTLAYHNNRGSRPMWLWYGLALAWYAAVPARWHYHTPG